jgi:arabinose-5-phosphate isomerase
MGKAGLIGQKIAATLSSLGTRSHFLHPAEALHGDLGRIHADDVVLIFSQSGETLEVVRLLPSLATLGVSVIAVTCRSQSTLARATAVCLDLGPIEEACPLALAPTTSTAAMLAVGDALALVVSQMRGFEAADFARYHPGGSLGFRLSRVEEHMRPPAECRIARDDETVREVLSRLSRPGRRTGAIMLTDAAGRLSGLFTDSDLARLFERGREAALDGPIGAVMTPNPKCVVAGTQMSEAVELLARHKISELLVVDAARRPIGLIDITDVVAHLPSAVESPKPLSRAA